MNMLKKTLLLVCMMALVVCISVGATIAYLTSQDAVTNTFTVGQVGITLDEAKVNTDGTLVTGNDAARVDNNEYHLLPGHEYTKDPIVHVNENSESCWVFVKVINEISGIESKADDYINIDNQIKNNGWKVLPDVANVYYQEYTKNGDRELEVFQNFKIDGSVNNTTLAAYAPVVSNPPEGETGESVTTKKQITVTAYAIQKDGFTDPNAAWKAGNWD